MPEQKIQAQKLERNQRIVEGMITLVESELKDAEIQAAVTDSTATVLDAMRRANPLLVNDPHSLT